MNTINCADTLRVASKDNFRSVTVVFPKIPNFRGKNLSYKRIKRANRYLLHQEKRLARAIQENRLELSTRIYSSLVQRSWSFKVAWINKVCRSWYWSLSLKSLKELLLSLEEATRKMSSNPIYKRTYIPKSNNRIRPLGVPSIEHRILNAMWALYLRLIIDPLLPSWQHGFRPKRSIITAWLEIWQCAPLYKYVYEFDLQGFFNNVSPRYITDSLRFIGIPESLVSYISRCNTMFPLMQTDKLEEEMEITRYYIGGNTFYRKSGLPQGLPWSPILCMLALSYAFRNVNGNLIMFADDGVLLTNNPMDTRELRNDEANNNGIIISSKLKKDGKPSWGFVTGTLTFLGHSFDLVSQKHLVNGNWIRWCDINPKDYNSIFGKTYGIEITEPKWWFINVTSWMYQRHWTFSMYNARNGLRYLLEFLYGKPTTVLRKGLKFFHTQKESTNSSLNLLEFSRELFSEKTFKTVSFSKIYESVQNRMIFSIQDIYPLDEKYLNRKDLSREAAWSIKQRKKLLKKSYEGMLVLGSQW